MLAIPRGGATAILMDGKTLAIAQGVVKAPGFGQSQMNTGRGVRLGGQESERRRDVRLPWLPELVKLTVTWAMLCACRSSLTIDP